MKKNAKGSRGKVKLTPLERETRNSIVSHLSGYGLTNLSIANIMNMHESTVSRAIDSDDSEQFAY